MASIFNSLKFAMKDEYFRNISVLFYGGGLGQLMPILLMPFLTRAYSPEDFGDFGLFVGVSSIIAVFSTLKMDVAQVHTDDEQESQKLFSASIILSLFSVILISAAFAFFEKFYNNEISISSSFTLLPLSIFLLSMEHTLYLRLNRLKQYKKMSFARGFYGLAFPVLALIFNILNISSNGLIFGYLSGHILVCIFLSFYLLSGFVALQVKDIQKVIESKLDYIKFALPSGFTNLGTSQGPTIFINKILKTSKGAGFYFLIEKILSAPVALVVSSVGTVYRQKAQEEFNNTGSYNNVLMGTVRRLFCINLIPFSLITLFGQDLFGFVFGDKWSSSGNYASFLAPMFFFKVVVAPVMSSYYVSGKLRHDFVLQMLYFVLTIIFMAISYHLGSMEILIKGVSLIGCLFYISNFFIIKKFSLG